MHLSKELVCMQRQAMFLSPWSTSCREQQQCFEVSVIELHGMLLCWQQPMQRTVLTLVLLLQHKEVKGRS